MSKTPERKNTRPRKTYNPNWLPWLTIEELLAMALIKKGDKKDGT